MRAIRWGFPKLEALVPSLANRWFVKLFFTPMGGPLPPAEQHKRQEAASFELTVAGKTVRAYAWGSGPVVLVVHGWAGRSTQFLHFINPLVQAGHTVLAFDAPAHGLSTGKMTNLLEFRDAILAIERLRGPVIAVVAHSLGGAASLLSVQHGLHPQKVVLISLPAIGDDILRDYGHRFNASARATRYLNQWIETNLGKPFDAFSALQTGQYLSKKTEVLLIHDEHDREVPIRHAERFRQTYPQATLIRTSGLGHTRILKNEAVIRQTLAFISAPRPINQ
ncbi:alpha/beta hydrolase [Spirosoma arcticum]